MELKKISVDLRTIFEPKMPEQESLNHWSSYTFCLFLFHMHEIYQLQPVIQTTNMDIAFTGDLPLPHGHHLPIHPDIYGSTRTRNEWKLVTLTRRWGLSKKFVRKAHGTALNSGETSNDDGALDLSSVHFNRINPRVWITLWLTEITRYIPWGNEALTARISLGGCMGRGTKKTIWYTGQNFISGQCISTRFHMLHQNST